MRLSGLVLAAAVAVAPSPAVAWGATGHRVVGRIAENHLTPAAARAVAELLGPESLARVGTWADEIRSDPAWDRAYTWHFINIPEGKTLEGTERNPRGDVVEAIERFAAVLRDPAAARTARVEALKFLVHFVGDLHQPLHAGYGSDRGGNEVVVLWFGEPSNLHRVWDSELIDHQELSFSELAAFLDHPTPDEVAAWQGSGVVDWMRESRAELPGIYDLGDRRLGWGYAYRHLPLVERRLVQAGVRLAGLLNSIFAGD